MARDFYEILGVARDADEDTIRSAYRKLAHKYHPDKTGGDKEAEDKLKEINEAYDVLKNKEKRARYDRYGAAGVGAGAGPGPGAGFGGFGGFGGGQGGGGGSPFDDIFDAFFGGAAGGRARGPNAAMRGDDLEYPLRLTLREAAFGTSKTIRFKRRDACAECSGSGAAKGSGTERCAQCAGTGQVRMSQGFFSITRACPVCQGTGNVIKDPCTVCKGSGVNVAQRELTIKIPAGVDTGSRLRMGGEGESGRNGGPRGDLYVSLEVQADEIFEREGNDLHCAVPISFTQAILGAEVKVPTLEGERDLKIPAGTQSGTTFRMRGHGIPDLRGYQKGDLLVNVQVETPSKLTKEQKELIKKFEELSTATTYPLHKRFLDTLRTYFSE